MTLKGRVDSKGREKGKRQSLLGGKGDKVLNGPKSKDNKDKSPTIEDSLSEVEERGVTIEDVRSLALISTPIRKLIVHYRFPNGIVTYTEFTTLCLYSTIYPLDKTLPLVSRSSRYGHAAINMYLQTYAKQPSSTSHAPTQQARSKASEHSTAHLLHISLTKSETQWLLTAKWEQGDSELNRVTLIDYFSSEILVNKLAYPDVAMEH